MSVDFSNDEDYTQCSLGSRGDAEASNSVPVRASTLRKKGVVLLKGRPCRIVHLSTCVNGKHGTAKVSVVIKWTLSQYVTYYFRCCRETK